MRRVFPEFLLAPGKPLAHRIERRLLRGILGGSLDPLLHAPHPRRAHPSRRDLAGAHRPALEPLEPARNTRIIRGERAQHRAKLGKVDFQIADPGQRATLAAQFAAGAIGGAVTQHRSPQRKRGLEPACGDTRIVRRLGVVRAQPTRGNEERFGETAEPQGQRLASVGVRRVGSASAGSAGVFRSQRDHSTTGGMSASSRVETRAASSSAMSSSRRVASMVWNP